MHSKKKIFIICGICTVLLWMIIIFCFSGEDKQSSQKSSGRITQAVTAIIKLTTNKDLSIKEISHINAVIRKCAHFTLYFVLSLLVSEAFKFTGNKRFIIAIGVCAIYCVSDEVHQYFTPGRAMQIKDMLIDLSGGVFAVIPAVLREKQ